MLRLPVTRILSIVRQGSSAPAHVSTEAGDFVMKFRGAAQGPAALVAELIVGALADRLDLPVPERAVLELSADVPTDDRRDEIADLIHASYGLNVGLRYVPRTHILRPDEHRLIPFDVASRIVWLDWLTMNLDRTEANPNIIVGGGRYWLIDHGAALGFHFDWPHITEQHPHRYQSHQRHVLAERATALSEWDTLLRDYVSSTMIWDVLEAVPSELWMDVAGSVSIDRRRAAYHAVLWKRLHGERRPDVMQHAA